MYSIPLPIYIFIFIYFGFHYSGADKGGGALVVTAIFPVTTVAENRAIGSNPNKQHNLCKTENRIPPLLVVNSIFIVKNKKKVFEIASWLNLPHLFAVRIIIPFANPADHVRFYYIRNRRCDYHLTYRTVCGSHTDY